jgi:hypothetical protein
VALVILYMWRSTHSDEMLREKFDEIYRRFGIPVRGRWEQFLLFPLVWIGPTSHQQQPYDVCSHYSGLQRPFVRFLVVVIIDYTHIYTRFGVVCVPSTSLVLGYTHLRILWVYFQDDVHETLKDRRNNCTKIVMRKKMAIGERKRDKW